MKKITDDLKNNFEDISVVKKYFSRIFSVISKEFRERLMDLNFSEKIKKILLKDLAFLSEEKQNEYLDEFGKD